MKPPLKDKFCELETCKGTMIFTGYKNVYTWRCDKCKAVLEISKKHFDKIEYVEGSILVFSEK